MAERHIAISGKTAPAGSDPRRLFTGPSHSARLRNALRSGQLADFGHDLVGIGGMPIWSPRLTACRDRYDRRVHMVGDFRFGNPILGRLSDPAAIATSETEATGIDRARITPENDRVMYRAALASMDRMVAEGTRDSFLFWDLTIREYEARSAGRYMEPAGYRHPSWNLGEVLARYAGRAFDTRPLLEDARPFYIDSSAHPSYLGWCYIIGMVLRGEIDPNALRRVYSEALRDVFEQLRRHSGARQVTLCGNSKFCRMLEDYVRRGAFELPDWIEVTPVFTALRDEPGRLCILFPATFGEADAGAEMARLQQTFGYRLVAGLRHARAAVMFYDHWAGERIAYRPEMARTLAGKPPPLAARDLEAALPPELQGGLQDGEAGARMSEIRDWGGMIELGNTTHPTVAGVLSILARALVPAAAAPPPESFFALVKLRMTASLEAGEAV
ncbi:hypothetical protein [Pseudooceanicola sp.]|uniref:hypothetical protein n=1 Tax=Pseudooceanicola sp. TaxID=1914328 RepID=UPI0035157D92